MDPLPSPSRVLGDISNEIASFAHSRDGSNGILIAPPSGLSRPMDQVVRLYGKGWGRPQGKHVPLTTVDILFLAFVIIGKDVEYEIDMRKPLYYCD